MSPAVGIDSNTLTYLIDSTDERYDPAADKDLGAERVAMIRILFYSDRLLWVGPTVEAEYRNIPNLDRRESHRRLAEYVLEDQRIQVDQEALKRRVCELKSTHRGDADCQVVAEAEFAGLDTLLSATRGCLQLLGQGLAFGDQALLLGSPGALSMRDWPIDEAVEA